MDTASQLLFQLIDVFNGPSSELSNRLKAAINLGVGVKSADWDNIPYLKYIHTSQTQYEQKKGNDGGATNYYIFTDKFGSATCHVHTTKESIPCINIEANGNKINNIDIGRGTEYLILEKDCINHYKLWIKQQQIN